jgi:predicted RNA-binding protein with RPS1 domain
MERRNCVEVINKMLKVIPETEVQIICALENNKIDASYKAPEETIQWERTAQTLQFYIRKPNKDWHWKVLSIFSTKSIEEVKRMFNE